MFRTLTLAAMVSLTALPVAAETTCHQPYAPDISSSAAPTKQELQTMRDDVKSFIEASDLYQVCLAKSAMGAPAFSRKINALIDQSQHDKKNVGDRANARIVAFNGAEHGSMKLSEAGH